jgi:hypothetical protein
MCPGFPVCLTVPFFALEIRFEPRHVALYPQRNSAHALPELPSQRLTR